MEKWLTLWIKVSWVRKNNIIYNTVVTWKAKEDYRGITPDQENFKFFYTSAGLWGFRGGTSGKEPTCQCGRHKRCVLNPSVGKMPWRRAWQPIPVFLPGEFPGQRSLVSYSSLSHSQTQLKWLSSSSSADVYISIGDTMQKTLNFQGNTRGSGNQEAIEREREKKNFLNLHRKWVIWQSSF